MDFKNLKHNSFSFDNTNVHFYTVGEGKRKILLLPPYPLSGLYYFWLLRQFNIENTQLISLDIPGWVGFSDPIKRKLTADTIYQIVETLIEEIKLKKFSVLGFSFGGTLATRLAATHDEVERVVLVSPVIAGNKVSLNPITAIVRFAKKLKLSKEFRQGFNLRFNSQMLLHKSEQKLTTELWQLNEKLLRNLDETAAIDSAYDLFEIDWSKYLDKLKSKQVMIINSLNEFGFFQEQADLIRDTLANEKSIFLHGIHEDFFLSPDAEVLEQILTFLLSD